MVARWRGCDRVPPTCQHREQDAGDHKGLCWRMREIRDGAHTPGDRKGSPPTIDGLASRPTRV